MNYYINIDKTSDPVGIIQSKETEGATMTQFIAFCMHATAVYRLSNEMIIREFLFRVGIILNSYNILPNFLIDDSLISFEHQDKKFISRINDIVYHFGLEITNARVNMMDRDSWVLKAGELWVEAGIGSAISGGPVIDRVKITEHKYKLGTNKPIFNAKIKKEANIFADQALKAMGKEPFAELFERINREHIIEIHRRIQASEQKNKKIKKR